MADEFVWGDINVFVDCAFAAIGDVRLFDDDTWLDRGLPCLYRRRSGYGMLYGLAECDGLPIEGCWRADDLIGIRLEFTNDVTELEHSGAGHWAVLGRLRIGTGGAVVCDKKQQHLEEWRMTVPLPGGWYTCEAFETGSDHLGIRVMAEDARRLPPAFRGRRSGQ